MKGCLKKAFTYCRSLSQRLRLHKQKQEVQKYLRVFTPPYKLHLGCGKVQFDGWVNIDIDRTLSAADIFWDLNHGIPVGSDSCSLIYSEHLLEHISVERGVLLLRECYRVLQVGGVLRIAMPSLEYAVEKYSSADWRSQDWLTWPEYQFIQTRAEMLNIAFRWWGHQWLYDREELYRRLHEAGFAKFRDMEWGVSDIDDFRNRETRKDSLLICEVQK